MRRPQVDKKGRAVSWSFTEVGWINTHLSDVVALARLHAACLTPPGKHNPGIQLERTLPEIQKAQQKQRRQGEPVPVPTGP